MTSTGHMLDAASRADREALFAALQAAQLVIVELASAAGRIDQLPAFEVPVMRALRIGAPLMSPEDLAARAAGDHTGFGIVAEALRQPRTAVR